MRGKTYEFGSREEKALKIISGVRWSRAWPMEYGKSVLYTSHFSWLRLVFNPPILLLCYSNFLQALAVSIKKLP